MKTKMLVFLFTVVIASTMLLPLTSFGNDFYRIPKKPLQAPEGNYVASAVPFHYSTGEAFRVWPGVKAIQNAKSDFRTSDVATVDLETDATKVFHTKSGKFLVVFSGCREKDCGGNLTVILYDGSINKAYLLVEEPDWFRVYGYPTEEEEKILVQNFFQ